MDKSTCRWPECEQTPRYVKQQLCGRHYQRARKLNDFKEPWATYRPYGVPDVKPPCKWEGCESESECAEFCYKHYKRARVLGNHVDPWLHWDTSGACAVCGKAWDGGRNRNRRVCSHACRVKEWRLANPDQARASKMDAVRRRRARLQNVKVDHFTIADVRKQHGDDCYICGKSINYALKFPNPKSPSLDHVLPLSAGGSHTLENVAMTHLVCNLKKHAAPAVQLPQPTLL